MKTSARKGSALVVTMVLGIIMMMAVGFLMKTVSTELKLMHRNQISAVAFNLAENGIEHAAGDIVGKKLSTEWTTVGTSKWTRAYTYQRNDTGVDGKCNVSVSEVSPTEYRVTSTGTSNVNSMAVSRTIVVTFEVATSTNPNTPRGFVTLSNISFSGGNDINQRYTKVDSYSSKNNLAPGIGNKSNKAFFGSLGKNANFHVSNGEYLGTLFASDVNDVTVNKAANDPNKYLVSVDDMTTSEQTLVDYKPSMVRTDVSFDWTFPVPPKAAAKDGWVCVLPVNGEGNWKSEGKLQFFDPKKNSTPAVMTVSGNTVTIGKTDSDKHYIATTSLNNIKNLNVAGEVVIVVIGESISSIENVTFVTPKAKLTIYSAVNVEAEKMKTYQHMYYNGSPTENWESGRFNIVMLPGNHNINNMESLNPEAIQSHVETAIKSGPTDGATFFIHNSSDSRFVGQIFAPYSDVQLDCTVDLCGTVFAKTATVSGNCHLAYHFDESSMSGDDDAMNLTVTSWYEAISE